MKNVLYLLCIALCINNICFAQYKKEKAVAAAVAGLSTGMINADRLMLEKYTSEKLSYGHSSGKIQNQKEFIDGIVSGASDFVTIDLTDQSTKISGKTAIVRHTLSATTNDGGKPGTVKLYILLVWQKQHGNWKLLARQAVKVV